MSRFYKQKNKLFYVVILCIICFLLFPIHAQDTANSSTPEIRIPTGGDVQGLLKRLESESSLLPEQKNKITDLLNQCMDHIGLAAESKTKAAEFETTRQQAPEVIKQIQVQLLKPVKEAAYLENTPLEDLEAELTKQETMLADNKTTLTSLQGRMETRQERRKAAGDRLAASQKQLADLTGETLPQATSGEPGIFLEAQQLLTLAKRYALTSEIEASEKEIQTYDIRGRLLTARLDQAAFEVARLDKSVASLRKTVTDMRQREASEAVQEAIRQEREAALEAVGAGESLRQVVDALATEVAELTQRRVRILQATEKVSREQESVANTLKNTNDTLVSLTNRVEAVGLNTAIGLLLRNQRASLPEIAEYHRAIGLREQTISQAQVEEIEITEERILLADINTVVDDLLQNISEGIDETEKEALTALLQRMYLSKRNALDGLRNAYESYLESLFTLDMEQRQLITAVDELQAFIDERVLWIRSGSPLTLKIAAETWTSLRDAVRPVRLLNTSNALAGDVFRHPLLHSIIVLFLLALIGARRRLKSSLEKVGESAKKRQCVSYTHTLKALVYTLLLALCFPLLIWFIGYRLANSLDSDELARAIGYGLQAAALIAITATMLRNILRKEGLAQAHFGWPGSSVKGLRKLVSQSAIPIILCFLFIQIAESLSNETLIESFGRLVFLVLMILLCIYIHRFFNSKKGPLWKLFPKSGTGGKSAEGLWYLLVMTLPILLALLAVSGYTYTANQLLKRLYMSLVLGLFLAFLVGLIQRWILVARRSLSYKRAKERREKKKAIQEGDAPQAETPEEEMDYLEVIDTQTRRLVRVLALLVFVVMLWGVWAQMLPALDRLNEWTIWETTETILSEEGVEIPHLRAISIAHLMLAVIIGIFTVIAAKNIPGLLELSILQRLKLASGERYAIAAIVRYIIGTVGIIMLFNALGIGWANIQWIIAALGLGLGFGLQEIFANFVSGLVILFERSLRVGDTVTIGSISGKVSRIRMRATTITDFDRKELVVPNKEFVTGQVVNWTLSDMVLRVIVPVGIAYGSDTELAYNTLKEIAQKNTDVLEDPEPYVVFWGFGDSALNFELRVFVKTYETYLQTRHDLHMAIDQAFREKNISIAFPQRDIHVRSIVDALPLRDNPQKELAEE